MFSFFKKEDKFDVEEELKKQEEEKKKYYEELQKKKSRDVESKKNLKELMKFVIENLKLKLIEKNK